MFLQENPFHVLYTSDIPSTCQFFRSLGCAIRESTDDKVVVMFGGFELHFILTSSEPVSEYRSVAAHPLGQGIVFYIETDDIQKSRDQIKDLGGVLKTDIFHNHWGSKEFLFEDPNGYKFAIYQ